MDKVTLAGSEYTLPPNLCVSCNRSPIPNTFVTTSFEGHKLSIPIFIFDLWIDIPLSKKRDFSFPACEHCALLHKDFTKRVKWWRVMLIVVLLAAISAPFLALMIFVKSAFYIGLFALGLILIVASLGGLDVRNPAEGFAKRAIGDQMPPLNSVRVTKSLFSNTWNFHFENNYYATVFRSLNMNRLQPAELAVQVTTGRDGMDKKHPPEGGLWQYSFFELAFIGWIAGILVALSLIFTFASDYRTYSDYQTYSQYLLDRLVSGGILSLFASPGAITGGLVGGRLLKDSGQRSQIMGAAIGGAIGAFLLGCLCIAFSY